MAIARWLAIVGLVLGIILFAGPFVGFKLESAVLKPDCFTFASVSSTTLTYQFRVTLSPECRSAFGPEPYKYRWDFGEGPGSGVPPTPDTYDWFIEHTYQAPNSYNVLLLVFAADTAPGYPNQPCGDNCPFSEVKTVNARFSMGPMSFAWTSSGHDVDFTASASGGYPPYTYTWIFGAREHGDGIDLVTESPTVQYTYPRAGNYSAWLRVDDTNGNYKTATATVTIVDAPPGEPPVQDSGESQPAAPTVTPSGPSVFQYVGIGLAAISTVALMVMRRRR